MGYSVVLGVKVRAQVIFIYLFHNHLLNMYHVPRTHLTSSVSFTCKMRLVSRGVSQWGAQLAP